MTKKALIEQLIAAYEQENHPIHEKQLPKVWKRLMNRDKETLQKYAAYVEHGKNRKANTALVLALGTGILFTVVVKPSTNDFYDKK